MHPANDPVKTFLCGEDGEKKAWGRKQDENRGVLSCSPRRKTGREIRCKGYNAGMIWSNPFARY